MDKRNRNRLDNRCARFTVSEGKRDYDRVTRQVGICLSSPLLALYSVSLCNQAEQICLYLRVDKRAQAVTNSLSVSRSLALCVFAVIKYV